MNLTFHLVSFYFCCGLTGLVFIVLVSSLIKQRKLAGNPFHKKFTVELFWSLLPLVMLLLLALPAILSFLLK